MAEQTKTNVHEVLYKSALSLPVEVHKRLKKESFLETMLKKILFNHTKKNDVIWKKILKRKAKTDARREQMAFFVSLLAIGLVTALFLPFAKAHFIFRNYLNVSSATIGKLVIASTVASVMYFISDWREEKRILQVVLSGAAFIFSNHFLSTDRLNFIASDFSNEIADGALRRNLILAVVCVILIMWFIAFLSFAKKIVFRHVQFFRDFKGRTKDELLYMEAVEELKRDLEAVNEEYKHTTQEELKRLLVEYAPSEFKELFETLKISGLRYDEKSLAIEKRPSAPEKKMRLPVFLGRTQEGYKHIDLASLPHLLLGGSTGSGKSNFQNHLISELLPQDVELLLVDPEQVEFFDWQEFPNVRLVGEVDEAKKLLKEQIEYMNKAKPLFTKHRVKHIDEYNAIEGVEKMKRKVIVFDEFASFSDDKDLIKDIVSIARLGRKWGVHLVIGTQRPSADVVVPGIRNNFNTSLAFRVRDKANSKILNVEGAELIEEAQKGLAVFGGAGKQEIVQTPLFKGVERRASVKDLAEEKLIGSITQEPKNFNPDAKALAIATEHLSQQPGAWIPLKSLVELSRPERGAQSLANALKEKGFTKEDGKYRRTGRGAEYRF